MEMQQLRYVVAVARMGNFSRAAEQCHVSQPSLSQQIQKLEAELGERLFDRMKREVRLTAHGEAFLRRAVRILEEVDAAKREAVDAQHSLRGFLTIGVLPTIAPYLLPDVMAALTEKFPEVEIVVQEDTTARLLKLALAYEIDFDLASQPILDQRLKVREQFEEELLLALPPGHRLTRKRTVSAADLDNERPIVMKEGHCLGDQVAALLRPPRRPAQHQFPRRPVGDYPVAGPRRPRDFTDSGDGNSERATRFTEVPLAPNTAAQSQNCCSLAQAASAESRGQRVLEDNFNTPGTNRC